MKKGLVSPVNAVFGGLGCMERSTPLFLRPCSPPYPPPPEVPLFVFLRALLVFVVLLWCVDAALMQKKNPDVPQQMA